MAAVVEALRAHASTSAKVTASGCCAIGRITASSNDCAQAVVDAGGVLAILEALRAHDLTDAHITALGCDVIDKLTCGSSSRSQAVVKAFGLPVIVDALLIDFKMRAFFSDVFAYGCSVMGSIAAVNDDCAQATVDAGGVVAIVEALRGSANPQLAKDGCNFISLIAAGSNARAQAVVDAGGVPVIVEALRTHGGKHVAVARACFTALETLVGDSSGAPPVKCAASDAGMSETLLLPPPLLPPPPPPPSDHLLADYTDLPSMLGHPDLGPVILGWISNDTAAASALRGTCVAARDAVAAHPWADLETVVRRPARWRRAFPAAVAAGVRGGGWVPDDEVLHLQGLRSLDKRRFGDDIAEFARLAGINEGVVARASSTPKASGLASSSNARAQAVVAAGGVAAIVEALRAHGGSCTEVAARGSAAIECIRAHGGTCVETARACDAALLVVSGCSSTSSRAIPKRPTLMAAPESDRMAGRGVPINTFKLIKGASTGAVDVADLRITHWIGSDLRCDLCVLLERPLARLLCRLAGRQLALAGSPSLCVPRALTSTSPVRAGRGALRCAALTLSASAPRAWLPRHALLLLVLGLQGQGADGKPALLVDRRRGQLHLLLPAHRRRRRAFPQQQQRAGRRRPLPARGVHGGVRKHHHAW